MKISNVGVSLAKLGFSAKCSNEIKEQFSKGQDNYKSDELCLSVYSDKVNDIRRINSKHKVGISTLINSMTKQKTSIVVLKDEDDEVVKYCKWGEKSLKQGMPIELSDLKSYDGVSALYDSITDSGFLY